MNFNKVPYLFDFETLKRTFKRGSKLEEETRARYEDYKTLYLTQMMEYAYTMFEWINLPVGLDPLYLEQLISNRGAVAWYYDSVEKIMHCAPFVEQGERDLNGRPTKVSVRSINGKYSRTFPVDVRDENGDVAIIGLNSPTATPTILKLEKFAENIADMEMTKENRLNWLKAPFIYKGPKGMINDFKSLFKKIRTNEPIIVHSANISNDQFQEIQQQVEFIIDKLRVEINAEWDKAMLFQGIDNTNQDKTERMISDEVNANNEQVLFSRQLLFSQRKKFVSDINRILGDNLAKPIEVKLRNRHELDKMTKELLDKLLEQSNEDNFNGLNVSEEGAGNVATA